MHTIRNLLETIMEYNILWYYSVSFLPWKVKWRFWSNSFLFAFSL